MLTCILLGNYAYDRINSDKLAPPGTDNGQTINAQWPMGKLGKQYYPNLEF